VNPGRWVRLFTAGLRLLGGTPAALVLGKDHRVSTSKFQVLAWTYAIAFAMMSLVAATWLGTGPGFDALTDPDFDFEPYLVLLGGPSLQRCSRAPWSAHRSRTARR